MSNCFNHASLRQKLLMACRLRLAGQGRTETIHEVTGITHYRHKQPRTTEGQGHDYPTSTSTTLQPSTQAMAALQLFIF